jgi:hypothetical protein
MSSPISAFPIAPSISDVTDGVSPKDGARFFDAKKRDRGWAAKVVRRTAAQGRLIVLDVTSLEAPLASFLRTLDKGRLRVQRPGAAGESYNFEWASGYDNGGEIRVRGVLADD